MEVCKKLSSRVCIDPFFHRRKEFFCMNRASLRGAGLINPIRIPSMEA
jgi:hypothetical protein